jgi:hypothetical protein
MPGVGGLGRGQRRGCTGRVLPLVWLMHKDCSHGRRQQQRPQASVHRVNVGGGEVDKGSVVQGA